MRQAGIRGLHRSPIERKLRDRGGTTFPRSCQHFGQATRELPKGSIVGVYYEAPCGLPASLQGDIWAATAYYYDQAVADVLPVCTIL